MKTTLAQELMGITPKRSSKKKKARKKEETKLSHTIAEWLNLQYPNVTFRFDVGADIRLSIGQAKIVKDKLKHKRGYHDLTILEPRGGYFGLFLELKKDRSEVYTLKGTLAKKWCAKTQSDHNVEQRDHLVNMSTKGYLAGYGFGLEDTMEKINNYMLQQKTELNNRPIILL